MSDRLFENIVDKVCSTLDLQLAITHLQKLLEARTDIEGVFIGHHAPEEKQVYSLVYAGKSHSEECRQKQPVQDALHNYLLSNRRKELNIVNRLNEFPAMAITLPSCIPTSHSLYECRVRLDGRHIGMLAFHTPGPHLSDATLDLLMKIRGPIALSLANKLSALRVWSHDELGDSAVAPESGGHFVCPSSAMRMVYRLLSAVAPTGNTVLLTGETGVGKDALARRLHDLSPRRAAGFVHVNCGSLPESLIESELFGHQKGAFTGAGSDRIGLFEQANGGTVFLDEIGELPPAMQTRLLQVLQNKTIRRVGGSRDVPLDFRVVAATNNDLEAMCRDGRFRRDLYFRLNCIRVEVPPLRHRREDIPVLAEYFVRKKAQEYGWSAAPPIGSDMDRLVRYDWPGNVRELENCLDRSLILSCGAPFRVHLDPHFAADRGHGASRAHVQDSSMAGEGDASGLSQGVPTLDECVRDHMLDALRRSGGRIHGKGGAAELLDVNPSTLRSRLKKMNIPFGRQLPGGFGGLASD
ncbi:Transcriptional regulatory protein ZraR [Pseudodesulfovibrio hydrargyri]|uniref:Transcriptional regulatory protein ZraR n=1 Tax=Pseudodesulfovibrio hydrargyri TaxID=2125990 RepID=A0A1J5MWE8_9BACT|nr:sigma-54 dependent transcriptional regulator [Pseudodesulfovibrio hydrargyri]OIQ50893.1 Transcriptional regulatory protein ZraR [Pseudodesulfovibrio hydrargyri]